MAHNIDMTNDRANIAFVGNRRDIWHRLGTQMQPGQSIQEWAKQAGLDWQAVMTEAYTKIGERMFKVPDVMHITRSDNNFGLGVATPVYKPVQPIECLEWFQQYITHDDRFSIDVAGSLCGGRKVWATAVFNGGMVVGGDNHIMRLLMTTTFDATGATINKGTATRVVCNNTLDAALSVKGCAIKTRHSSKFDHEKVGKELAVIVAGFDGYKQMGDAMAGIHMAKDQVDNFFKTLLNVEDENDLSTRKANQWNELRDAYDKTVAEGTQSGTVWTALNAVTRYVDHDRGTRDTGLGEVESRFVSAQFSSGAAMKAKAVANLYKMFGIDKMVATVD